MTLCLRVYWRSGWDPVPSEGHPTSVNLTGQITPPFCLTGKQKLPRQHPPLTAGQHLKQAKMAHAGLECPGPRADWSLIVLGDRVQGNGAKGLLQIPALWHVLRVARAGHLPSLSLTFSQNESRTPHMCQTSSRVLTPNGSVILHQGYHSFPEPQFLN